MGLSSIQTSTDDSLVRARGGPVLLMSMRRMHNLVAFCSVYEFEDVITEVTGADRIEPVAMARIENARRVYKLTRFTTGSRRLARALAPNPPQVRLDRDYELFFPAFNFAHELFALTTVRNWRKRCRLGACFVSELWAHELPEYLLELLAEFDHIFVGAQGAVDEVARIVGRPCSYLPFAADVLTFSPYPDPPERNIDVCNIGRRSVATHAALVTLARQRKIHYWYDTVAASGSDLKQRTFRVANASEHRLMLASILQRSRYYLASRARVNEPSVTGGRDEIGARFYEGAAAGAVLIGEPPQTEHYRRQFDWPGALISLPFDSPNVAQVIAHLDADPERIKEIGRENARQAALRHDWVYRVRTVFETLGLRPTENMVTREERLRALAAFALPSGNTHATPFRVHSGGSP